jgi:hypothetical protein
MEDAAEVMAWYRDFIMNAPETLNGFFTFLTVPSAPPFPEGLQLQKMCGVVWCYTGPEEEAEATFAPVFEMGRPPALHGVHAMPFPMLQSAFDAFYPHGLQWYWKADFVSEIPDAAIAEHIKYANELPSLYSTMHLYPINGAAHRVGPEVTAWSYRDANWGMVIVGVHPDASLNDQLIEWARSYWDALHPYSSGGAYVNMMMDEGPERIQNSYRDNYGRLVEIKTKYDPRNFFRVNQNIPPKT